MISLNDQQDAEPLTNYGMMRKSFLKQHRPILYNQLVLSEKLYPRCREVQQSAEIRLENTMEKLTLRSPPPAKAENGVGWLAHMNTLHHIAEESILAELIYD